LEAVFTANHLTDTDNQNAQTKYNSQKADNTKYQKIPYSVASYDTLATRLIT